MVDIWRFRSLWGTDPGQDYAKWAAWFPQLKAQGYVGVEIDIEIPGCENLHRFRQLCDEVGLEISVIIFTSWSQYLGPRPDGLTPEHHLLYYRKQLQRARVLNPCKVNAQSGCDAWPLRDSVTFFQGTFEVDEELGLTGKVCHEMHRNRSMFNPYVAREILRQVPSLRITADFSHWVVVCERLLTDGNEDRELIRSIIPHVHHMHTRTGTTQSSQCPDPTHPTFAAERASFEQMWKEVIEKRVQTYSPITFVPEYGPYPYHPFGAATTYSEVADAEGARLQKLFEDHLIALGH